MPNPESHPIPDEDIWSGASQAWSNVTLEHASRTVLGTARLQRRYLRDMSQARELADGRVKWVETCFWRDSAREAPYWEEFLPSTASRMRTRETQCRDRTARAAGVLQLRLHEAARRVAHVKATV